MAWDGYFAFGGNEFINVARTEAYAKNDGAGWFRPVFRIPELSHILGDPDYRSPLQDADAPWLDPNDPDTYEFYGAYPLNITGLEDSTRSSTVTENIFDGGNTGFLRHGTRSIVFNLALMGSSDAAVDAGLRWLKQTLLASRCTGGPVGNCDGDQLCYMSSEPAWDGVSTNCADPYMRYLLHVQIVQGPTITAKNTLSDGSAVWQVTFTAVAGLAYEFGSEVLVIRNALLKRGRVQVGDGVQYDSIGGVVLETKCPSRSFFSIFDPLCAPLIAPPGPPGVSLSCFTPPVSWQRYSIRIPGTMVPTWDAVVPRIAIHTTNHEVRNLRLRFYADPERDIDPEQAVCGYCLDFVISYIPPGGTFTIDVADQAIYYMIPGGERQRADSLVFSSDGSPFEWPELTCGVDYLMTVDTLRTQVLPSMDVYLTPKAT